MSWIICDKALTSSKTRVSVMPRLSSLPTIQTNKAGVVLEALDCREDLSALEGDGCGITVVHPEALRRDG